MSYTNNWTQAIRQTLREGHSKEELEKLSVSELKKLHDEYSAKEDDASQKEAKMIEDILDSRKEDGEKKEEDKDLKEEQLTESVMGIVKKLLGGGETAKPEPVKNPGQRRLGGRRSPASPKGKGPKGKGLIEPIKESEYFKASDERREKLRQLLAQKRGEASSRPIPRSPSAKDPTPKKDPKTGKPIQ